MFKSLRSLFSSLSVSKLVIVITFIAMIISALLVYVLKISMGSDYTHISFIVSVVIPAIMVPPNIIFVVKLSKHLKTYKDDLDCEVEKNRQKDILLFEQARFALMGEMMANISHQWKQPLNNVGLAIVSSRISDSDEIREKNFDIMEENINYLANTINDFMSFFEKETPSAFRPINEILTEVQSIMRTQVESKGIKLSIDIDKELSKVTIRPIISQVIVNLINNSKDALIESVIDKEIQLYIKFKTDGLYITCCDNGIGIDEAIASKIFDPYFTTKDKTRGTGIGLYMSKQIVNKIFDGNIFIDNSTKKTCIRVDIPYSTNCQLSKEALE